jgi:hypothetical protein
MLSARADHDDRRHRTRRGRAYDAYDAQCVARCRAHSDESMTHLTLPDHSPDAGEHTARWDRYRPSRGSRWTLDADRVVLLSLDRGRLYTTDGPGAALWQRLVAGERWSEIAATLSPSVEPSELDRFARGLLGAGLLQERGAISALPDRGTRRWFGGPRDQDGAAPRARVPTATSCMLTLARVKLSLRRRGFAPTLAWAEGQRPRIASDASASAEVIDRAVRFTRMAAALVPGRHECLEQSLCLVLTLREAGHAANIHFAARGYPFVVHAWVELNGCVLNDAPDYVASLLQLVEVP